MAPRGGAGAGNGDHAMGAPPGALRAIEATPRALTNTLALHPHGRSHGGEELTPRAGLASLIVTRSDACLDANHGAAGGKRDGS